MASVLTLLFQIAGLGLGIYRIWPDVVPLLAAGQAGTVWTFPRAIETGERALTSLALIMLPFMATLKEVTGTRLYGTLKALVFSGLTIVTALVLHASINDGYAFSLSQDRQWISLSLPAGIFVVVLVNWLIAFAELRQLFSGK